MTGSLESRTAESMSSAAGIPPHDAVLLRLRSMRPELRPSEKRIADLFIENPAGTAPLSIGKVAVKAQTSTTSVVRFCQRLGYAHYTQFRLDVLHEAARERFESAALPAVTGDIDRDDTPADIIAKVSFAESRSIADTATVLDTEALGEAIAAVVAARRVDSFGVGASSFVGHDLQQKLTRIGRTALSWPDAHAAWTSAVTLDADCVAIAISHSGDTHDTVEFLALANASGATTIAITNHAHSPLAGEADIVLATAARETSFRSGALGSRIAQLMVVDCLFIGVAQSNYDQSMAALRSTYAAVHHMRGRS